MIRFRKSTASALNSGYHVAYLIGAALVAVAMVVAVCMLRSEAPASAREEADAEAEPTGAEPAYSEAV